MPKGPGIPGVHQGRVYEALGSFNIISPALEAQTEILVGVRPAGIDLDRR